MSDDKTLEKKEVVVRSSAAPVVSGSHRRQERPRRVCL